MDIKKRILDFLHSVSPAHASLDDILVSINAESAEELKAAHRALNSLADSGDILTSKKGKYLLPSSIGLIKGRIQGTQRGFGFLIRDDGNGDVFIPAKYLENAFDGDTVFIKLLPESRGVREEGKVEKIISRGREKVIGTYLSNGKRGFVTPDDKRFPDVSVDAKNALCAVTGDKVVANIASYDKGYPEGKITEVLGKSTDKGVDIISVIKSYDLKTDFPIEVIAEAKRMPLSLSSADIRGRRDFTGETVITIDGEDAKDLDDAVSVTKNQDGTYRLSVHIADVANYVTEKTALDKEALERGTSIYFPDRVIPMLPKELSNGICSLNENVPRLTLSVIMDIDAIGKVVRHEIVEGVIKTKHRMTYTSVTRILDGDPAETKKYDDVKDMLFLMKELAEILIALKTSRGSIDFDMPECKIVLNEDGSVIDVLPYERTISHRIIEEFMILANETVAEFMCRMELPFVYRIHEVPSEEKMQGFKQLLQALSVPIKSRGELHSKQLLNILDSVRGKPIFAVINRVMLRSMQKAKYSPVNVGHFGLASKFYCHFTSPIRRYPDLAIHRIIKYMLSGELNENRIKKLNANLGDIAARCSEREKIADEAERDADNLKKAEYMKNRIGEKYEAIISGVTGFGIFAELKNTVEGLIRIDNLPQDVYNYMENIYALVGAKHKYRLGDSIGIVVSNVSGETGKVEFLLDEDNCTQ